ncbi:MAG: hypothetical protein HUK03_10005, partial [Bacteroidaceae bacterium]|nr:hypothetical protein [Bacteroidaceae bacterium]
IAATLPKHWRQLLLPTLTFCLIGWPYYIVREMAATGAFSTETCIVKPLLDILLLIPTTNGVMWFVVALLEMKLLADLCHLTRHPRAAMTALMLLSLAGIYGFCDTFNGRFAPFCLNNLATFWSAFAVGVFLREPTFRWGEQARGRLFAAAVLLFAAAIAATKAVEPYMTYLIPVPTAEGKTLLEVAKQAAGITSSLAWVALCMSLSRTNRLVEYAARHTIVTLGLHFMMIGSINIVVKHFTHTSGDIIYPTLVAMTLAVLIEALCCLVTPLFKTYLPWAIGNR